MFIGRKKEYIRPKEEITLDYIRANNEVIEDYGNYLIAKSRYPYDNTKEHLIMWINESCHNCLISMFIYNQKGFYILKNPEKNQSIKELEHWHFLKY